jgi:hypothetical protein
MPSFEQQPQQWLFFPVFLFCVWVCVGFFISRMGWHSFAARYPAQTRQLGLVRSVKRSLLILLAFGIGIVITALTATLSYLALPAGSELVSEIVFWPNTLMQSLVPIHNIGTPEHPFYEGTPLNIVAFIASFPLAVLLYGTVAYVFLRRRQRYHGTQITPTV